MPRKQEEQDETEQLGRGQIIKGLPGHDTMAVSYEWFGVGWMELEVKVWDRSGLYFENSTMAFGWRTGSSGEKVSDYGSVPRDSEVDRSEVS